MPRPLEPVELPSNRLQSTPHAAVIIPVFVLREGAEQNRHLTAQLGVLCREMIDEGCNGEAKPSHPTSEILSFVVVHG